MHTATHPIQRLAASLAQVPALVERCTLYPFVVTTYYQPTDGPASRQIYVEQAFSHDPPDGQERLPDGARFIRSSILPASRFDTFDAIQRRDLKPQYRAFLMWRQAHALGKSVADLEPWSDYDAIDIDERVERWSRPHGRFCGD